MNMGSRYLISRKQVTTEPLQNTRSALYQDNALDSVDGSSQQVASWIQDKLDENWAFPHIIDSDYKSQRTGSLIETFVESYMHWENRDHVLAWIRSFENPLALHPVFLDVETTGLRRSSEVIEVAIVDEDGQTLFHSLVKPTTEIEPVATAIHGITSRHVRHAPLYPQIHDEVMSHLQNHVVIAFNISFNLRLLRQTVLRYHLSFPRLHAACLMYAYAKYRMILPKQVGRYKTCSLEEALIHENLNLLIQHRAEVEAQCIRALFQAMKQSNSRKEE